MIAIYIDTRDSSHISVKLKKDSEEFSEQSITDRRRPESVTLLIEKVCQKASIKIEDIDEIYVKEGPGSYTGIKVGASVGNALSFALQKPINGLPLGDFVDPKYE